MIMKRKGRRGKAGNGVEGDREGINTVAAPGRDFDDSDVMAVITPAY